MMRARSLTLRSLIGLIMAFGAAVLIGTVSYCNPVSRGFSCTLVGLFTYMGGVLLLTSVPG
jgi:Flp pilus assembly pilin Flp